MSKSDKKKQCKCSPGIDYDRLQQKMMDMLLAGTMHSTLVGKIVTLGGSRGSDIQHAEEFVEYTINLIKKAENYQRG